MYCDSHRFCEHIRIIASSKIKELSGAARGSIEMLKQFEQRYLHIRILGKVLGFLESSVYWSMGLDPQFQNVNASEALQSYIDNCTNWVEDAKRSIDVISQLKKAWIDGSLVSTIPWIVEYLKPLKFDTAYSRGKTIKSILDILWHIRNFALQSLESRAGLLIVSCIDKLLIHLRPSFKKNTSKSNNNSNMYYDADSKSALLVDFAQDKYGTTNKSLDSNVLDMQEGLVDDSVFKKSFKEFEYIALLFSERKKKASKGSISSKNDTMKKKSGNDDGDNANLSASQNNDKNSSSHINTKPHLRTPAIKAKRDKKYKLRPTNINDWRSSAKKNLSYWFYEKHEVLKELTDIVLDRCIKNSIKIAKDLYLDKSVDKIVAKHEDKNDGLVESFNAEEGTLLQNCFRCAQILCKDDIEQSILALAPAKYFHWNDDSNENKDARSRNSNNSKINKLPTSILQTCIKLAISQGNKFLKEMLGDSIGAEFRRKINNWERKNDLLKNGDGSSNLSLKWRRSHSSEDFNASKSIIATTSATTNDNINNKNGRKDTAKKDRNSPVINIRSHLSRISKMTNILLSAPKDKIVKKTFNTYLNEFSNVILENDNSDCHNNIDNCLIGKIVGFIQKDCLYLSIKLFNVIFEDKKGIGMLKEETFSSNYILLSTILTFASNVFCKLLSCSISTTSFGMSLLHGIGVILNEDDERTEFVVNLLVNRNIISC